MPATPDVKRCPLWTAIVTPFTSSGEVDYPTLEKLVRAQDNAQNGLLILGSTGEALNLDEAERKKIVEFAVGLKPKMPMMVGVGGINLNETQSWINFLEKFPLQAYLLVVPLYAKPGVMGQYHWFKTLLDTSTRPCMLYNIPGRSATFLQFETVEMLKDHPNFWSIKEASGKVEDFKRYKQIVGDKIQVFSGDDALLPAFVPHGCAGLVSVASNVWPKETHLYTKMCLKKEMKEIEPWKDWSNTLFLSSNPVPVKRLMFEVGQINSSGLRLPLSHEDLSDAKPLLKAHHEVEQWYKGHL